MTQSRIRWTVRALRRLDEIGAYIEKDDPDAAARVFARLVASVDMLVELPTAGRIGRITGTREVVLPDIPHIIPYRIRQDISEMAEKAVKAVCLLGRTPAVLKLQSL